MDRALCKAFDGPGGLLYVLMDHVLQFRRKTVAEPIREPLGSCTCVCASRLCRQRFTYTPVQNWHSDMLMYRVRGTAYKSRRSKRFSSRMALSAKLNPGVTFACACVNEIEIDFWEANRDIIYCSLNSPSSRPDASSRNRQLHRARRQLV